jgi:hypothetical protein
MSLEVNSGVTIYQISGGWMSGASTAYTSPAGSSTSIVFSGESNIGIGSTGTLVTPEDVNPSYDGVRSKRKTPERPAILDKKFSPEIFIKFVKSKLSSLEQLEVEFAINKMGRMLMAAKEIQQTALHEQLALRLAIAVREQEARAIGCGRSLNKTVIKKYITKVEDRVVKFDKFENFPRVVPAEVAAKIKAVQATAVFDEYHILYVDYTSETLETNKRKIEKKDPVLFGCFSFQPDIMYFIIDWIDKYCDLTLSKLIGEIQVDDPEFKLDMIPQIDQSYVDKLIQEVIDRDARLRGTTPKNYKALMAEEDRLAEIKPIVADPEIGTEPLPPLVTERVITGLMAKIVKGLRRKKDGEIT